MLIGKLFTFEAAHRLPEHDGHCKRLHGHSYTVEVVVDGPASKTTGMVADFGTLSRIWKGFLEPFLDHRTLLWMGDELAEQIFPYIGEALVRVGFVPSAENIATFIKNQFEAAIDLDDVHVHKVRVWETAKSWAEA